MNLSFYVARRYIFSKKSHQVINIISGVAISGVALATAAMVCVLSVFNGFQSVVAGQFSAMEPDIKITASSGKGFMTNLPGIARVMELPQVAVCSYGVEDRVMVQYGGKQVMAKLKGVDDNFVQLTGIGSALYGNGEFVLHDDINSYAVMGGELMRVLNCGIRFTDPLEVYAPNRDARMNLAIPSSNFNKGVLLSSGLIFAVNQPEYDAEYILTSAKFARKLFRRAANEATSLELRIKGGEDVQEVKREIAGILGEDFVVSDRYEQQKDVYKVMQIEKLISYIFLSFILLVACFNIIGSLAMLIIEKRDNMNTLRSLGAENHTIANVFVIEGCMISSIGAVAGILVGLSLCIVQQEFGLLSMGGNGLVAHNYPVAVEAGDVVTVFVTVLAVGFMAVWLPVRLLTRKFI